MRYIPDLLRDAIRGARPHGTPLRDHPMPGSEEYAEHVEAEIEHYGNIFREGKGRESLLQPVPPSWNEVEKRAAELIRAATGKDLAGHVVERLNRRPGVRMLSLGSGPGGLEISFARSAPLAQIVCTDINDELLELGRQQARKLDLAVKFERVDLNTIELPPDEFDVAFCHAALHHVIELERLVDQVRRTLKPGGEFIALDVVTRNGYLLWPETRQVVRALWMTLPERYRLNHTGYAEPRVDDEMWESDTSEHGMECIRSEDILPVLDQAFVTESYVPYFSICRRFLDTMYGPNYDLSSPLDMALLNWIWELDLYYVKTGQLRPEMFFGMYRNM